MRRQGRCLWSEYQRGEKPRAGSRRHRRALFVGDGNSPIEDGRLFNYSQIDPCASGVFRAVLHEVPVLKVDQPLQVLPGRMPEADQTTRRLYDDAAPSVVRVKTGSGGGSGFFADEHGRVVTNAHVVQDETDVSVITHNGDSYRARIEKLDDINDLAVLKLENLSRPPKFLDLGSSYGLLPDQSVYAFGHPNGIRPTYISPGYFRSTGNELDFLTAGDSTMRAAIARRRSEMTPREATDLDDYLARRLLQGRVHLRGGNSGGPLLDEQGKVVGVSDSIEVKDNSKSYFIPVERVRELLRSKGDKFEFSYAQAPEPWADLYKWQWHNMPTVAAVETGIAGVSALGLAKLAIRRPGVGTLAAVGIGVFGLSSLAVDAPDLLASTSTGDRWKHGLASASDLLMAAGAVTRFIPAARSYSLLLAGAGVVGKIGKDFIPNRLVLTDIRRKDGDMRPPFDPEKI